MKTIILVLFIIPLWSVAQKQESSTIKINGLQLPELIKGLLQSGYAVNKSEGSLQYIFTVPKKLVTCNISTQIKAEVKKDCILLSELYTTDQVNESGTVKSTDSQADLHKSWEELQRFATSFNKPLEYQRF